MTVWIFAHSTHAFFLSQTCGVVYGSNGIVSKTELLNISRSMRRIERCPFFTRVGSMTPLMVILFVTRTLLDSLVVGLALFFIGGCWIHVLTGPFRIEIMFNLSPKNEQAQSLSFHCMLGLSACRFESFSLSSWGCSLHSWVSFE